MTKKYSQEELANNKSKRIMDGVATWCSFYRSNPHRFCKDYLNIDLKLFQKILLFMMNYSTNFMYLASRGQGKSFLVAIFCVVRCILYPGTRICVTSKTRPQATEVLEKVTTILMPNSDNLKLEIDMKETVLNQSKAQIVFRNTSLITVVTANESARHNRSNIIVIDEFRMVDKDIINTVIRKFNTAPRQPSYLKNPQYSHLKERNKEMYMSSAWFKSHWSFEKLIAYCSALIDDTKKYFVVGLPYQLAIKEDLLDSEQIADEMSESDFNEIGFSMEMECMWFGDTDGSFFKYDEISKTRKIQVPFYPKEISDLLNDKKIKIPPLLPNERRVLSADLAVMGSKKRNNDATSIFINQAFETEDLKYTSNIIYTECFEGLHTEEQALIIRRLYDEFLCTDLCIDIKGVGFGIADALLRDIYDPSNGKTYPALTCCNNPEFADRCNKKDAESCIWAIQATESFNTKCAMSLREAFKQNKIRLLISEIDCNDYLKKIAGYLKLSPESKIKLQLPYIQTTLLINELINLQFEGKNTNVKVYEKSGFRKDKYSSLSYNYWVICQLEDKIRKPKNTFTVTDFQFRKPKPYGSRKSSFFGRK